MSSKSSSPKNSSKNLNGTWSKGKDKDDRTYWRIKDTHPEYINILRCIILRKIPALSFSKDEKMEIIANRLVLTKEQIARQIEDLPIHYPPTNDEFKIELDYINNIQVDKFLTTDDCLFTLNGKKISSQYEEPYNIEPMPLYKNQLIKFSAIAVEGIPEDNAKFKSADASFESNDEQNVFDFWIESHRLYQTPEDILKKTKLILKELCEDWYKSIISEKILENDNDLEVILPFTKNNNQLGNLFRYRLLLDSEITNCYSKHIEVMKTQINIHVERRENKKTNFKKIIRKVIDNIK